MVRELEIVHIDKPIGNCYLAMTFLCQRGQNLDRLSSKLSALEVTFCL